MTTVKQSEVDASIQQLANIQGILTCAVKALDEEVTGSPLWEVSEAIHGAIRMVEKSYVTLNDNSVKCMAREA